MSPKTDEYNNTDVVIKDHCVKEWPDDFAMRAHCEKKQYEAVRELQRGKPSDIPEEVFGVIRAKCAQEWPDDFAMRAHCEKRQYEASKILQYDKPANDLVLEDTSEPINRQGFIDRDNHLSVPQDENKRFKCPNCGTTWRRSVKFCGKCGAKL